MKPEVQSWYDGYKNKTRTEVLAFQARWIPEAPQYLACSLILSEMDERDRAQSDFHSERRHRESLAVDLSARRIAVVALIVAGIALVNDFGVFGGKGSPATPGTPQLPSSSTSAHPAEPKPASQLSTATASALPAPTTTTPAKPLPSPEPTPDTPPTPQK